MTDDPSAALREQARERGRRLLADAPYAEFADRATLLLTSPPTGLALTTPPHVAAFWLLVEADAARALPDPMRRALMSGGSYVERMRPAAAARELAVDLTVSSDGAAAIAGSGRRALEARWAIRHAEALHDRLGRHAQLIAAANRYPDDAPERIVRSLWLPAVSAVRALWVLGDAPAAVALPVAGEASAMLCRLACVFDEGDHPTPDLLLPAARQTRIGRRIATWLDDLAAALCDDAAATRRVGAAAEQVLREVTGVLGELYRDRAWLREPEAYALRPSR